LLAEKLASEMYLAGINCIFTDGYNTSLGVYSAAKNHTDNESTAYVAGFEADSLHKGYTASGCVTLVSVIGLPSSALEQVIKSHYNNSFSGGKTVIFTAEDECVGIDPYSNNLSPEVLQSCNGLLEKLKNKSLVLNDPTNLLN